MFFCNPLIMDFQDGTINSLVLRINLGQFAIQQQGINLSLRNAPVNYCFVSTMGGKKGFWHFLVFNVHSVHISSSNVLTLYL